MINTTKVLIKNTNHTHKKMSQQAIVIVLEKLLTVKTLQGNLVYIRLSTQNHIYNIQNPRYIRHGYINFYRQQFFLTEHPHNMTLIIAIKKQKQISFKNIKISISEEEIQKMCIKPTLFIYSDKELQLTYSGIVLTNNYDSPYDQLSFCLRQEFIEQNHDRRDKTSQFFTPRIKSLDRQKDKKRYSTVLKDQQVCFTNDQNNSIYQRKSIHNFYRSNNKQNFPQYSEQQQELKEIKFQTKEKTQKKKSPKLKKFRRHQSLKQILYGGVIGALVFSISII